MIVNDTMKMTMRWNKLKPSQKSQRNDGLGVKKQPKEEMIGERGQF